MHLLKDAFKVENCFSVAVDMEQAIKVLQDHTRFDIIVLEKNLYMTLDEGGREMLRSLVDRRRRLSIMIEPDCDYQVDEVMDNSWYHNVLFPFPSAAQLRSEFGASSDTYAKMLSTLDEPRASNQPSTEKSFTIMVICSSTGTSKLKKKKLSVAISEMNALCSIDECSSALTSLDKCCTSKLKSPYDMIIVDNALKLSDIQACELLEFLRNQPTTKNSLIISLTKSVITNTSALMDAGADVIWSKPLPEKEELKKRIVRLCKHKFLSL